MACSSFLTDRRSHSMAAFPSQRTHWLRVRVVLRSEPLSDMDFSGAGVHGQCFQTAFYREQGSLVKPLKTSQADHRGPFLQLLLFFSPCNCTPERGGFADRHCDGHPGGVRRERGVHVVCAPTGLTWCHMTEGFYDTNEVEQICHWTVSSPLKKERTRHPFAMIPNHFTGDHFKPDHLNPDYFWSLFSCLLQLFCCMHYYKSRTFLNYAFFFCYLQSKTVLLCTIFTTYFWCPYLLPFKEIRFINRYASFPPTVLFIF